MRGAIIGCGFFAQFHIEAWLRLPEVELAAACDVDIARARAAAPNAYMSAEEMFAVEQLDFVDIATRPDTHLPLVRLAAQHKVPVICQKPMAPDWETCLEMASVAERAGIPLMIHENWRWQPWYRELKQRIDAGDIGRPIGYRFRTIKRDGLGAAPYPAQPYFKDMPRLIVFETIIHHIDTARFLFGDVSSVFAKLRKLNPLIAGEDQAFLTLCHSSDLVGAIEGNRFVDTDPKDAPALGESWFDGDNGTLRICPQGDIYHQSACVWRNQVQVGYRGDSVLATQRHFIQSLTTGGRFETGAREYLGSVAVMEAAYRSNSEGCLVPVEARV